MPLEIELDESSPFYLQIIRAVREQVESGTLSPGEELPSVRALAHRLKVNPNTIARAYSELESEGIVAAFRTRGTYISEHVDSRLARLHRKHKLSDSVDALLKEARQWDVSTEEVIELIRERDEESPPQKD